MTTGPRGRCQRAFGSLRPSERPADETKRYRFADDLVRWYPRQWEPMCLARVQRLWGDSTGEGYEWRPILVGCARYERERASVPDETKSAMGRLDRQI